MLESRWILRTGGPALGLIVVGVLASASSAAGGRGTDLALCADPTAIAAAVRKPAPADPAGLAGESWYRLDAVLDDAGSLLGQRLVIGTQGRRGTSTIDLPPEAFAAGPFGRAVLYGADDGVRSELSLVDPIRGCRTPVGTASAVIRSATVDPDGNAIYEHRVDRASRVDLGVFRRSITSGDAEPAVPPLPADERFGPTFSTQLSWATSGDRLAIHACGVVGCRLRVHEPATGRTRAGAEGVGPLVGLVDDRAIVYDACLGLPCPILSVNLTTRQLVELSPAAGTATVVAAADGPCVVHETTADQVRVVRADGSGPVTLLPPDGRRLVPLGPGALSGMRAPAGWLVVSDETPSGRTDPGSSMLLRLSDGMTAELPEVAR